MRAEDYASRVDLPGSGIEYAVMAAYAEGLNILRNANVGKDGENKPGEPQGDDHLPAAVQADLAFGGNAAVQHCDPGQCATSG